MIRLFSGAIYMTSTDFAGHSSIIEIMGKNAASVLPDAVDDDKIRSSSLSKMTFAASACIGRSVSHPFLYMNSRTVGENL